MSRRNLGLLLTLAALAAGALWWTRRPTAAGGPEDGETTARDPTVRRPPRFVAEPGEPEPTIPMFRAPAPDEDPASGPPPGSPAPSTMVALEAYRAEICACQDLQCAERVGRKHTSLVAATRRAGGSVAEIEGLQQQVVKCLQGISTPARAVRRPGGA